MELLNEERKKKKIYFYGFCLAACAAGACERQNYYSAILDVKMSLSFGPLLFPPVT
jgi:hypothetical protein